jgi:hypothetical protein
MKPETIAIISTIVLLIASLFVALRVDKPKRK